jgi:DNA primase
LPSIQLVSDRVERSAITNEISDYLKLDRGIIADQLRQTAKRVEPARKQNVATSSVPPNELLLLTCLLLNEDARETIKHYLSTSTILQLLEMKVIFEMVLTLSAEGVPFSLEALANRLEPRFQRILTDLSFSDSAIQEQDAAQQALHCLRALEAKAVSAKCSELKRRIREFEEQGNFGEAMRLANELDRSKGAQSGV